MARTFIFRTGSVDPATLQDGMVAVFNASSDPSESVDIRRVRLLPVSGTNPLNSGTLKLCRISAISGGDVVVPSKHDTSSSDLPAQVLIRTIPDSVTTTSLLRRIGEVPVLNSLLAGSCIARSPSSPKGTAKTQSDDLWRSPTSADVERIILREGEGLAICEDSFSVPHAGAAGFCVRNTSSGACYTIRSRDVRKRGTPDLAHIAILNGSGSGIILEIFNIQYPEEGESTIPQCRLAKICGYEGGIDSSADIIKPDTEMYISPSIKVIEGPFRAKLMGEDSGNPVDWHIRHGIDGYSIAKQQDVGVIRRFTFPVRSTDQSSSFLYSISNCIVYQANGSADGIILRNNEGLALLAGRAGLMDNSTMNCYQVEIVFNYNPPSITRRSTVLFG